MTPARKGSASKTGTRRRPAAATAAEPEESVAQVARSRRGAKRTVMDVVLQLPNYLRLLFGLITDRRVQPIDKLLVVGAIAYIISPLDLIPDFLPFFGQVDDAFLLIASIERLITNAGSRVVLAHWRGDPSDLSRRSLRMALVAASFFLPRRVRRRLRGMVG